jgi:hypothetical protein
MAKRTTDRERVRIAWCRYAAGSVWTGQDYVNRAVSFVDGFLSGLRAARREAAKANTRRARRERK